MASDLDQKLLAKEHDNIEGDINQVESLIDGEKKVESLSTAFKTLLPEIFKMSISFTMSFLTSSVYLVLLQDKDSTVQSAVSLGTSIMNVFGSAIFTGLNFGLMNRLTHVYGAKNLKLMGLYLHRGLIVNLVFVILCCVLVYFLPQIFGHFGYSPEILPHMANFTSVALFAFPFYSLWQVYSNYLSAISDFKTPSFIQIASCIVSIGFAFLFIKGLDYGVKGAALCYIIQQIVAGFGSMIYVYKADPVKGSLFKFERDSFRGVWDLFKYQVRAGGQAIFDWIGFEILILFSGTLPVDQCDALVLTMNLYYLSFATTVASGVTTSSFVGNFMGEKDVKNAKVYAKAGIIFILGFSFILVLIFLFLCNQLADLYSSDDGTQYYMVRVMRLFTIMIPCDFMQYVLGSILRAIKLENKAVAAIVVNIYVFGVPSAFIFVLVVGWEVYGIVAGMFVACFLNFISFLYLNLTNDWHKLAETIAGVLEQDDNLIKEKKGNQIEPES